MGNKIFKFIKFLIIILLLSSFFACTNQDNNNIGNNNNISSQNQESSFYKTISPKQWHKIYMENINNSNYIVLDVRTKEEYDNFHIKEAKNIDYYSNNFKQELSKLDKNKIYLIYCRSSHRSTNSMDIMKSLGFRKIYNLEGGILLYIKEGYFNN